MGINGKNASSQIVCKSNPGTLVSKNFHVWVTLRMKRVQLSHKYIHLNHFSVYKRLVECVFPKMKNEKKCK